jgi:PAS domain S-box-containing protein
VKGTVTSLEILKQNARRLAANDALLAPIEGGDEIAEVDSTFHEMARQLKEASEQLDESYRRLQAVIDTVPIAIIICEEDGKIESVNNAGLLLFDFLGDELQGTQVADRFGAASKPLDRWLEETRERPLQIESISKEKEVIPSELSVLRLHSPKGPRYLLTVTDITERFKMEKMKRDFLAMVSHDIRSPLTSINAGIELIKAGADGEITPAVDSRLTDAQNCAQRLLSMVGKLLDLERLDSGAFNFELTEFVVADVVQGVWNGVAANAHAKQIKFHISESDVRFYADRESVEHVVQNFLSNAIKFSPEGGLIRCNITEQAGGMAKVSISDEGSGVPDRYKEAIFERFKQVPQGRARKDGTGLGLSICKQIIEALGGKIGVEDREGGGSTFWFTLPSIAPAQEEKLRVEAVAHVPESAN